MKLVRRLILTAGLLAALVAAETVVCGGEASRSASAAVEARPQAIAAGVSADATPQHDATTPTPSITPTADR